jgi:hypothetical protein
MNVKALYRWIQIPHRDVLSRSTKVFQLNRLRLGALGGAAGLIVVIVSVLTELVTVTGDPRQLQYVAFGAFFVATLFARYIPPRAARSIGFGTLGIGLLIYLFVAGIGFQLGTILRSNFTLMTGVSLLQLEETTIWALCVTPGPVFLTWYFALRRRYKTSVLVGSAAIGFFVLTGDAGPAVTLIGVISGAALLGFGDLEQGGGSNRTAEYLLPVLAVMIITPLFISVIPGSNVVAPAGLDTNDESFEDRTMVGNVVETNNELDIIGSVTLSPEVQFTVQAENGQ